MPNNSCTIYVRKWLNPGLGSQSVYDTVVKVLRGRTMEIENGHWYWPTADNDGNPFLTQEKHLVDHTATQDVDLADVTDYESGRSRRSRLRMEKKTYSKQVRGTDFANTASSYCYVGYIKT